MRMEIGLSQAQVQKQILSPQMIQSMEILVLNSQQLEERIEEALEENIALELEEPAAEPEASPEASDATGDMSSVESSEFESGGEAPEMDLLRDRYEHLAEFQSEEYYNSPGARVAGGGDDDDKFEALQNAADRPASLQDFLMEQVRLRSDLEDRCRLLCFEIIHSLDPKGWLLYPLEDVLVSLNEPAIMPAPAVAGSSGSDGAEKAAAENADSQPSVSGGDPSGNGEPESKPRPEAAPDRGAESKSGSDRKLGMATLSEPAPNSNPLDAISGILPASSPPAGIVTSGGLIPTPSSATGSGLLVTGGASRNGESQPDAAYRTSSVDPTGPVSEGPSGSEVTQDSGAERVASRPAETGEGEKPEADELAGAPQASEAGSESSEGEPDLSFTREELDEAWQVVRSLDPGGVGATDLRDCLVLQLDRDPQEYPLERVLIESHLPDIAKNRLPQISKATSRSIEDIKDAIEIISSLNPNPGKGFSLETNAVVRPDVFIEEKDGEYRVKVDNPYQPKLRISPYYKQLFADPEARKDPELRKYIGKKIDNAQWLLHAIFQRRSTLQRVAEEVVQHQQDFFRRGIRYLKPLKMQEIADKIGVNVSTVSRAISGKYFQAPGCIKELKFLFTGGTTKDDGSMESRGSVIERIKKLIDEEEKRKPLSDSKIVTLLSKEGIHISRRTVTKYREAEGIPSSRERRVY